MRSRSKAFSTRSDAQSLLGLALHMAEVAGQPVAFVDRAAEVGLQLGFFRLELLGRRTGAAVKLGDGSAQIVFGLVRHFDFTTHLVELEVALIEQPRLFAEAIFQILGAASEKLGLRGLRHQLLFEFGDAAAEILDPAALFGQFLGGGF